MYSKLIIGGVTMLGLVFGLIASAISQPVHTGVLEDVERVVGIPVEVLSQEEHLQDIRKDNNQVFDTMKTILEGVQRHSRELQTQVGRQTAATLATSLGDLIRPAITAFVGALSMNSATSITNAVTALLGGRSLDLIPAETFMTAPVGRESAVVQPTREEVQQRRPSRRKQKPTMYNNLGY